MFGANKQDGQRKQILLQFVALLNEGRPADAGQFLAPSCVMSDDWGAEIDGRDNFVRTMEVFSELTAPQIELTSIQALGDDLLVRGYIRTETPGIGSESFWRIGFDGEQISRIEVTRRNREMTLPGFYKQRLAESSTDD